MNFSHFTIAPFQMQSFLKNTNCLKDLATNMSVILKTTHPIIFGKSDFNLTSVANTTIMTSFMALKSLSMMIKLAQRMWSGVKCPKVQITL